MRKVLEQAFALLQQGRLQEAELSLRRIVNESSPAPEALHLLGICRLQQGDPGDALRLLSAAVEANPGSASSWSDRGWVLSELGRHEDALLSYQRALALDSRFPNAMFNRGVSLERLQRSSQAAEAYAKMIAAHPRHLGALVNLGNVLCVLGRHAEAVENYERALVLQPNLAVALTNRGAALVALNRAEAALVDHRRALAMEPRNALALNNQGIALAAVDRHEEALGSYDLALALAPGMVEGLQNRANSLAALKRYAEAAAAYHQVLTIDVDRKYALGDYAYALAHACNWHEYATIHSQVLEAVSAGKACVAPFAFLSFSSKPADQLACAAICVGDRYPPKARTTLSPHTPSRHDRIRVAYLSANFHDHAMARLMAGLFESHDRSRFEVWGVSFGPRAQDSMRDRLVGAFEHFIDLKDASDDEATRQLHALEMDIAVELMGFTEGSRLGIAARRAAPVQVNYMGYPGTLAAAYIDYILADRIVLPEEETIFYSEKVVYMPDSYFVNDARRLVGASRLARREQGLPENAFVFCCFNNNYKITPDVFDIWMRLLRRLPGSVLWLVSGNNDAPPNLRREAQARGVEPDRIVFAPMADEETYLARLSLADLFLDTLPYNAHTTACDALWVGLPVLTCRGMTFAGRVGASLLCAIGMPELIAEDLDEYETLAFRLAGDAHALTALRGKLARNRNGARLFDTERWRLHVEWAYTEMWRRQLEGERPQSFAVPPQSD